VAVSLDIALGKMVKELEHIANMDLSHRVVQLQDIMLISPGNGLGKSQNLNHAHNARSKIMITDLWNLLPVIFGSVFIYFSKIIARKTAAFSLRTFHRQQSETGLRFGFLCYGVISIIFGLLSLIGIIRSR